MKKKISCLCSFIISIALIISGLNYYPPRKKIVLAASYCTEYSGNNIEAQNYDRWSSPVSTSLYYGSSNYTLVFGGNNKYSAFVETYSSTTKELIRSKNIPLELPIFGGVYKSANYFFIISGQNNSSMSDSTEVYRITKYDKNWKRLSSVGLSNCNTTNPFDAGSCRMSDNGTYLFIRTCHKMYNGHQANVTIQVHMDNMQITDSYTGVMNTEYGYVSHSFNQFINVENNRLITVDHGDAYPRSIVLLKYKTDVTSGKFFPGFSTKCNIVDVLPIKGNTGANDTGATVGGLEISSTHYLVAGNSIIQDDLYSSRRTRNIFLSSVDKETLKVTTNWLTAFPEDSISTSTPQLVKITDNKFMVLWSHNGKIYYVLTDASGSAKTRVYSSPGNLSDCKPIYSNKKVTWVTRAGETTTFYEIPVSTPQKISKTEITNGHDMSGLTVSGTTSTLSCPKCGQKITVYNVDTDYSIWWRNTRTQSSYWSEPTTLQVGDTMEIWVNYSSNDATKNQEYVVQISRPDILSFSGKSGSFVSLSAKKSGTCAVKIYSKWKPSKYVKKTITVTESDISDVLPSENLTINGFQYNTSNDGIRTVYTASNKINNLDVIEAGLIYGLASHVSTSDMKVFSSNKYVYSYQATAKGILSSSLGGNDTSSYVMTIKQPLSKVSTDAITAKYYVRPYVELSNGTYLYGDICNYTLYNIANKLYKTHSMNSAAKHDYLYNNILAVITPTYKKIAFDGTYGIVTLP